MKDILGYEGQYTITEDGKVWSLKHKKYLKEGYLKTGYARVGLRDSNNSQKKKSFLVHRLVAIAYLENKENKAEVNHKNGIRNDNRLENLEWVTRSENNQYAWTYGKKVFVKTDKFIESVRRNMAKRVENLRSNYAT
jgi:hypothetical protein